MTCPLGTRLQYNNSRVSISARRVAEAVRPIRLADDAALAIVKRA